MRDTRNIEGVIRDEISWRDQDAFISLVGCGIVLKLLAACGI